MKNTARFALLSLVLVLFAPTAILAQHNGHNSSTVKPETVEIAAYTINAELQTNLLGAKKTLLTVRLNEDARSKLASYAQIEPDQYEFDFLIAGDKTRLKGSNVILVFGPKKKLHCGGNEELVFGLVGVR